MRTFKSLMIVVCIAVFAVACAKKTEEAKEKAEGKKVAVASSMRYGYETDTYAADGGDLDVVCIGHGTLMLDFNDKIIHIDPVFRVSPYQYVPKADLILITHHHGDHLDTAAISFLSKENTEIIYTELCEKQARGGKIMRNGETITAAGFNIEAIPAYNIVHKRNSGDPFHIKGEGNGYIISIGGKRVYIAGDTENIPEMKALKNIDIAFLPMNLPYTMTPEMVADAAKAFKPNVLYPYHYGDTDPKELVALLKDSPDIDVRVRKMR